MTQNLKRDTALGLFSVTHLGIDGAIYEAYAAATDCIDACINPINPEILERYKLPPLEIGVGMGRSKTIVMAVGYEGFRQPRAAGKCVYYATKLSKGKNQVCVDDVVKRSWPVGEGGPIKFKPITSGGVSGYVISKR